jgi:hypothetical protein
MHPTSLGRNGGHEAYRPDRKLEAVLRFRPHEKPPIRLDFGARNHVSPTVDEWTSHTMALTRCHPLVSTQGALTSALVTNQGTVVLSLEALKQPRSPQPQRRQFPIEPPASPSQLVAYKTLRTHLAPNRSAGQLRTRSGFLGRHLARGAQFVL